MSSTCIGLSILQWLHECAFATMEGCQVFYEPPVILLLFTIRHPVNRWVAEIFQSISKHSNTIALRYLFALSSLRLWMNNQHCCSCHCLVTISATLFIFSKRLYVHGSCVSFVEISAASTWRRACSLRPTPTSRWQWRQAGRSATQALTEVVCRITVSTASPARSRARPIRSGATRWLRLELRLLLFALGVREAVAQAYM